MRLLKRQPGLPFLLALGVMLILSASFLAVQLWSEDVFRGAAEALEAPMMPPALPTAKKGESKAALEKKIEIAKASASVEVVAAPEVQEPVEAVEPAKVETPAMVEAPVLPTVLVKPVAARVADAPVKDVKAPAAAKEAKVAAKKAVADSVEMKPVAPIQDKPVVVPVADAVVVVAEPETASQKPMVSAAKASRVRKSKKTEVIETEVPPEWDWFSTPLKLEVSSGNVEIVPAERVRELRMVTISARLPEKSPEPVFVAAPASAESASSVRPALETEMPFTSALARMAKLRYSRKASVKASPEIARAAAAYRSPSLARLQQVVAQLRGKLEAREIESAPVVQSAAADVSVVSGDTEESSPVQTMKEASAADGADSEKIDVSEHKFVPYYGGSGTELSTRINDLVQRGVGYSRR